MRKFIVGLMFVANVNAVNNSVVESTTNTVEGVQQTVSEVNDIVQTSDLTTMSFGVEVNLWPFPLNQNNPITNTYARSKINTTPSHVAVVLRFDSIKPGLIGFEKSVESYFSLNNMVFMEQGFGEGNPWAQETQLISFVYGNRYYLEDDFSGFGYGWYAGLGYVPTNTGYWWETYSTNVLNTYDNAGSFSPIAVAEIFYEYDYNNIYILPRILIGLNTQDYSMLIMYGVMIGYDFSLEKSSKKQTLSEEEIIK